MNGYIKRNSKKILLFLVILLIFAFIYLTLPEKRIYKARIAPNTVLIVNIDKLAYSISFDTEPYKTYSRFPIKPKFPIKVKVPKKY